MEKNNEFSCKCEIHVKTREIRKFLKTFKKLKFSRKRKKEAQKINRLILKKKIDSLYLDNSNSIHNVIRIKLNNETWKNCLGSKKTLKKFCRINNISL